MNRFVSMLFQAAKYALRREGARPATWGTGPQPWRTRPSMQLERLEDRTALTAWMLDPTFGTGGTVAAGVDGPADDFAGLGQTAALQADGKIVVVGTVYQTSTPTDFVVSRYNPDGSLDPTFDGDGRQTIDFRSSDSGISVAVDGQGRIVVAGYTFNYPEHFDFAVARLNPDGSLDTTFGSGGRQTVDFGSDAGALGVAVDGAGRVVLAGWTSTYHTVDNGLGDLFAVYDGVDFAVARLNDDGSLDPSFDGDGRQAIDFFGSDDWANGVVVDGQGRIVVAGVASNPQNGSRGDFAVARLTADGTLDGSFDGDGRQTFVVGMGSRANAVAVDGQGRIVLAGLSTNNLRGTDSDFALARLNPDGSLDGSFDGDGRQTVAFSAANDEAYGVVVQPDGKVVVAGYTNQSGTGDFALARFNDNGSLDASFGAGGTVTTDFNSQDDYATGVLLQPDGRIVAVGSSFRDGTNYDVALAAYAGYDLYVTGTPGDDVISVEPGTQAGTLKVTVNGVVQDNQVVSGLSLITGLDGNDTITVSAAPEGGLILFGQGGSDDYTVNLGNLAGVVRVLDTGAAGTDRLTVHGTPGDDEIYKDATTVTLTRPVSETVRLSGIEYREIRGGDGDDLIIDPGSDTAIYGEAGNDTIVINATTGTGVTADGGAGSDAYVVVAGSLGGPVVITDSGTTGTDRLTVRGTAGDDTVVQTPTALTINGATISVAGGLEALAVDGGGGRDGFSVAGTPTLVAQVQGVSDMVVYGTAGNDTITFTPGTGPGEVVARLNGSVVARFSPSGRLEAWGAAGDDDIQVAGGIGLPAWLYGGAGDDRLKGGAGADVLLGGDGDDLLLGGDGRDLLLGGAGADRLVGNAADDILIAGRTAFDGNAAALAAIVAEWTSARSYSQRVANISGQTVAGTDGTAFGGRANGAYFLKTDGAAATVSDDGAVDVLTGSAGADWFLFNDSGSDVDRATDLSAGEFAADLDWINNGF